MTFASRSQFHVERPWGQHPFQPGAYSVIVQLVVEPMEYYTALIEVLDPVNNACFGNSLSKFILDSFLGYDDVLMSSIKSLAEKEDNKVEEVEI